MQHNTYIPTKARTGLTSLERLERQLQAITPDRARGDAWEKALKGWINVGGNPELTKAWMWGEWPGKLKAGVTRRSTSSPLHRTPGPPHEVSGKPQLEKI